MINVQIDIRAWFSPTPFILVHECHLSRMPQFHHEINVCMTSLNYGFPLVINLQALDFLLFHIIDYVLRTLHPYLKVPNIARSLISITWRTSRTFGHRIDNPHSILCQHKPLLTVIRSFFPFCYLVVIHRHELRW